MLLKTCRTVGVEVQKEDLDPEQMQTFLDERRTVVAEQLQAWGDKKAAKMLRG